MTPSPLSSDEYKDSSVDAYLQVQELLQQRKEEEARAVAVTISAEDIRNAALLLIMRSKPIL